jgi:hypothetical protein
VATGARLLFDERFGGGLRIRRTVVLFQMETRSGEDLRDAPVAHPRAQRLQTTNDVGDELREPIDRHRDSDERVRPFVVEPAQPVCESSSS